MIKSEKKNTYQQNPNKGFLQQLFKSFIVI